MPDIRKTCAIILGRRPFKESSLIVSAVTRDFGRIKLIARGCRRPRSKFCGTLEPFCCDEIIFYHREQKELYTLSDAVVINDFPGIRTSLKRVTAAQIMCEFLDKALPAGEINKTAYRLLLSFLQNTDQRPETMLRSLVAVFLAQGLIIAGIKPHLINCVVCRAGLPSGTSIDFDPAAGGAVCKRHSALAGFQLHASTVKELCLLYENRPVQIQSSTVDDLMKIIPAYLAAHLNGLTLNALKYLQ